MGFGGPSQPYALVQHERYPVKRVPGKQWKYLETPFKKWAPKLAAVITARVERELAKLRA
jgi:hypothetical protein